MELTLTPQWPSLPSAARDSVTHVHPTGQPVVRTGPVGVMRPVRLRAAVSYHPNGFGVDTAAAGKDVSVFITQLAGDVRGVPPRGRPV